MAAEHGGKIGKVGRVEATQFLRVAGRAGAQRSQAVIEAARGFDQSDGGLRVSDAPKRGLPGLEVACKFFITSYIGEARRIRQATAPAGEILPLGFYKLRDFRCSLIANDMRASVLVSATSWSNNLWTTHPNF